LLIKLVLFSLFFIWVIQQPTAYRESVRASVQNSDPTVIRNKEEPGIVSTFVNACKVYKAGDLRRTKSIGELASLRLEQLDFEGAESLFHAALVEHRANAGFDEYYTELMLNLAEVFTVEQKLYEAQYQYSEVLAYDKKFLDKTDGRLARDYNNLALNNYLLALKTVRSPLKTQFLNQANDYYKQALAIYRSKPKTEHAVAVVLYNQHLALRDLDDRKGARLAKAESDKIEATFHRPIKAP
jgi:tetratricopeptide (TPR) repeat protein